MNKVDENTIKLHMENNLNKRLLQKMTDENNAVKEQLAESEKRVEELMGLLEESRAQFNVYIPKKDDKVDNALAKAINNYPEKEALKILFLRESAGVYQFGQRKVGITVNRSDNVLVRIGGGYQPVEEFIQQMTESEVQKIERKNVMARFRNTIAA